LMINQFGFILHNSSLVFGWFGLPLLYQTPGAIF
jgi:hypothetical protein